MLLKGKDKFKKQPYNVTLDRFDDLADAFPLVGIFCLAINHLEALKNIYDIINSPSLYLEFSGALVQIKKGTTLAAKKTKKPSTELAQTFFFTTVRVLAAVLMQVSCLNT